jgi:hypothetical protein
MPVSRSFFVYEGSYLLAAASALVVEPLDLFVEEVDRDCFQSRYSPFFRCGSGGFGGEGAEA